MTEADVGALLRAAVMIVLKLGGPPLMVALLVGLVMSLVQAVTQVNEPTVAFVPKLLAVFATLLVLGPFMQSVLADFARLLFDRLVAVGGS